MTYCSACYARKVYCRRCKTHHCGCSWSGCPQWKEKMGTLELAASSPTKGDGEPR